MFSSRVMVALFVSLKHDFSSLFFSILLGILNSHTFGFRFEIKPENMLQLRQLRNALPSTEDNSGKVGIDS